MTLKVSFIFTFCSFLFGFSGTSKYKVFSDFKFKSNKLLALSVTFEEISLIESNTRHFPSLTPFNKKPSFHSKSDWPDSFFLHNICFPIKSEQDVSSVHNIKSTSDFSYLLLT